jgi:hypothetical protein
MCCAVDVLWRHCGPDLLYQLCCHSNSVGKLCVTSRERERDLSLNIRPLSGIQLCQLMPTCWNASSRGLRPPVLIVVFLRSITFILLLWRSHHLDALFLTQVYFGFKICPSLLEIVCLRVPARYIRDFALFNVCSSCKNCLSARCVSAANVVCRDVDVFGARNILLRHLL